AEAALRRSGHVRRRLAGHGGAIRQGRDHLPDVGRRAAYGRPQAAGNAGVRVPDHLRGTDVFHQEEGLGRRALSPRPEHTVIGGLPPSLKLRWTNIEDPAKLWRRRVSRVSIKSSKLFRSWMDGRVKPGHDNVVWLGLAMSHARLLPDPTPDKMAAKDRKD